MIVALVVLALTQVSIASQAPQAPPRDAAPVVRGSVVIRDRVVGDDTGEPVRGCRVMLMAGKLPDATARDPHPPMNAPPIFARTNEEGRYEFSGLAADSYRVSAAPASIRVRHRKATISHQ
jgi:hypothetical protein